MVNPHGTPIWYELVSQDADAARAFYESVLGWRIDDRPTGEMDYRMIAVPGGDNVGGLAGLGPTTPAAAATPGWRFYLGVDDVDEAAARVVAAGGGIAIPPFDLPGIGRMALVSDPGGTTFFVMRGASDEDSTAFDRTGMGKCNWNELASPDHAAANAFYAAVFGWTYPDKMTMPGDLGDYVFVQVADETIGATMPAGAGPAGAGGAPAGWRFYFRAPDIDAAADAVRARGGVVHMGPQEVPGGERIIVASDPHGAMFGVVGPG